jgi:hypothetical protein
MQKEFEKNFEYMSQEMARIYLQNTENEYKSLDENFLNFQKIATQKILSKCGSIVGKISLVSESVNQMENDTLQITLKPKPGDEKEFDNLKNELFVCASPFMTLIDYDLNYKKYFEKLNDTSYSLCLKDCKNFFSKKFSENQDDIKFNELKYCLRDCYNLSTFNFRSYYDSFMTGLENDLEEIKKL